MDCSIAGCVLAAMTGVAIETVLAGEGGAILANIFTDNRVNVLRAAILAPALNLIRMGSVLHGSLPELFAPDLLALKYISGKIFQQVKKKMFPSEEEIRLQYEPIIEGFSKSDGPAAIVIFDAGRGKELDLTKNLKELFKQRGLELQ